MPSQWSAKAAKGNSSVQVDEFLFFGSHGGDWLSRLSLTFAIGRDEARSKYRSQYISYGSV
jgi:hypothetical protein